MAWRELDRSVAWDEASGKPYSFVTYPIGPKLRAYEHGIDRVEVEDAYAACLCSMHYATIVGGAGGEAEEWFVRSEEERQRRLKEGMSGEEFENLDYNLGLLKLCDGLSLFVCLNRPGETDRPPPYPQGLWLAGTRYEFVWVDSESLRVDPNPFLEPFDVFVPYHKVGKDRRPVGSDSFGLRVTC